jgi:type III pantothenate kinase
MKLANTCLQMDVGNSGAKWRLLDCGEVVSSGRYELHDADSVKPMLECTEKPDQIWISSVASADQDKTLEQLLREQWAVTPWFARTRARTGTLQNSYAEPERMGVDRWLAMLGGCERMAGRYAVIDAGSALTIDIVDEFGIHEGGYIIPGPALMERALLLDTNRVRFDEEVAYALNPGRSTAEAVRHGVAAAQAGSVRLVLDEAGVDSVMWLFCGGGAETLMKLLGTTRGLAPDLVFEGLTIMAQCEG